MEDGFFRELTPTEVRTFRAHAREKYIAGEAISDLWHPVYRAECQLINWESFGWPYPKREAI